MTLRTTSLKIQRQVWVLLVLVGLVAYLALVLAFGLGNPLRFFGSHQMRVFIPIAILVRWLVHECRWDGVAREEEKKAEKEDGGCGREGTRDPTSRSSPDNEISLSGDCGAVGVRALPSTPTPTTYTSPSSEPLASHLLPETSGETAEALWERAREMVHHAIPDPVKDAEYIDLVFSAAERGHVPALAKLGEYAFRRGAFVEAYFWTTMAKRRLELSGRAEAQGLKEIGDMLRNIRREWSAAGQPPEFENVYENFPEERGELGRAFLRLDGGARVGQTREYLRQLADKGNPDAALFVKGRT